jgi:hypothetical protein
MSLPSYFDQDHPLTEPEEGPSHQRVGIGQPCVPDPEDERIHERFPDVREERRPSDLVNEINEKAILPTIAKDFGIRRNPRISPLQVERARAMKPIPGMMLKLKPDSREKRYTRFLQTIVQGCGPIIEYEHRQPTEKVKGQEPYRGAGLKFDRYRLRLQLADPGRVH